MMLFLLNFETISTSITRSIHKENLKNSPVQVNLYGTIKKLKEKPSRTSTKSVYIEQISDAFYGPNQRKAMVLTEDLYKLTR